MATQKRFVARLGLDNNSQTITSVADPVNAQDAATKNFASNAANLTAGTLAAARLPAFSGDATSSAGSSALTLANSGVTAGTYNDVATAVRPFTVDAKGRVTGIGAAVTITPAFSSVTNKPTTLSGYGITDAAPLASPALTGTPTAPTASAGTNSTQIATTAFVSAAVAAALGGGSSAGSFSTLSTSGDVTIGGNLTINGTTTTVNSTVTTIDDPVITLGGDAAPTLDDGKDRGVEFRWHNGTAAKVGFFGFDDSTGKFTFIPDATNTSEAFSGTKGTIDAYLAWADVTGRPTTLAGYGITDAQALDADLTAIAGLAGTSGFLKKTAANTWSLDTATYLTANQTVTLSGDATGSGSTAIAVTLANSGVTAGTYNNSATAVSPITVDAKGRVTGVGAAVTITPTWSSITSKPTTLSGYGITDAASSTHNHTGTYQPLDADLTAIAALAGTTGFLKKTAADTWTLDTATYLTANQNITVSGDASGTGTTAISLTLANSGVTAGTYRSVTVDAKGRVTTGTNPTTLSGYGITDAAPSSHVGATGSAHGDATTSVSGFMSATDKSKLDGIAAGANAYVHPSSDGSLHVPATGTTSNGKVLVAGSTAGSFAWTTLDLSYLPDAAFKKSVRAATTANITLSGLQTVDGIVLAANDRVLVKDQTTASQNGIYLASASTWTRATDFDTASKIAGATVNVDSGTVNGGIRFDTDFKTTDTLGTTALTWARVMDVGMAATTTPAALGTAAVGTSLNYARADHVHALQSITVSGDASGSGTTAISLTLANSGVTAGTYNNSATAITPITVDAKGRVTGTGAAVTITPAFSSITGKPTTLAGYGITDAQGLIAAGTTSQYYRGDKTWVTLDKAAVGLGSVENTALSTWAGSSNLTTAGNLTAASLTVTGNLTINGTTTTVNSAVTTLDDPVITLGGDTAPTVDDGKDRGVEFRWHNGTAAKVGFFGFDDSTGKFTFIPDATNTSEVFSGTKGTIDAYLAWADITSKPTTLSGYGITDAASATHNHTGAYQPLDADLTAIAGLAGTSGFLKKTAADTWALDTSTYLTANQNITVSGDASGSGTTAISLTLANSGVTAGTYKSVTVDAKGRVTAGTNPTTLSGYGITDAAPSSHVGATGSAHGVATTSVAGFMSATDKSKLDGIAAGANAYVHPTSDGNLHVPATGTTSNGKVLVAGSSAGSVSWQTLDMTYVPDSAFKKSVKAGSTAALTVTATATTLTNAGTLAAFALDGISLAAGDRVLIKNQATAAQNGIYTVTTVGSASVAWVLTRPADADTSSKISCAVVAIDQGTANGSELWTNTFRATDTLGTTAMNWYEIPYNSGTWGISVTGNAATATKLATARTITLAGDVTGSASFDGSANISITATVADDSHNHTIANVDNLQTTLDEKASLSASNTWTKTQAPANGSLTDTATIAWDGANLQVASVTLAGNRTLGAMSGIVPEATYVLIVSQDATGNRTLAWNSVYKFAGGTVPTLTTAADAVDVFTFVANAAGTALLCIGQSKDVK